MPHEFTKKKKKFCFEVLSSLIPCNNTEPFLDQIVMCNKKWIFYDNQEWPAQCLDQETPKHLSKPNLYQKKVTGHCLVVFCWNDPLQLSESQWNHYTWEVCSKIDEMHWKLQCLQLALVNSKGPILPHDNTQLHIAHPTLRKFDKLGYKVLPHLSYSAELLPTNYHLFKHLNNFFVGKTLPQSAGCRKRFLRVCWILKHRFSHYRNKQTYFSLAKFCWF